MHERSAAKGYFKNQPTLLIIAENGRHFWASEEGFILLLCL